MAIGALLAAATVALQAGVAAPPPALTPSDVASFFDDVVPERLEQAEIAGAVVAVVKDGRVVFAKGYGSADVAAGRPVSADTTLFRVASVSKLFTWTAVMQLVEQGKLDLDRDVNHYLDFQLPATYAAPITLRHLMTHTAGLQAALPDHSNWVMSRSLPLKEYLLAFMPPRIFPPGKTPAYSNYGASLAGYIVERVSGQPYEEYVADHIFTPLGMRHSSFAQPLPAALAPLMSNGYGLRSGPPGPFALSPGPAGGLSSTASDIAQFMLAHLQGGRLNDAQILTPATTELMHRRHFGLSPSMNAMALGFVESTSNGYRLIGHGGGMPAFTSQVYLVPSLQLGFFMSQNSTGRRGALHNTVWAAFFDRYFPAPARTEFSAAAATDTSAIAGLYKNSLRFERSPLKLITLRTMRRVGARADGTITVDGRPMREVEPLVFRAIDGQARVAFRRNDAGQWEFVDDFPFRVFHRVPWYERADLNVFVLRACVGVFALTVLLWPVGAVARRYRGRPRALSVSERRRRVLVWLTCVINLVFIWAGYELFRRLPNEADINRAHLLQAIGIAGACGTLIVLYDAARCWSDGGRGWFSKLHAAALSIACLGFLGFALLWRLFDFSAGSSVR